ncbi:hypothetical protein GQ44DRAFT_825104 [Phaeosphaeriaceae sp. PMI808]|nr:hypothetical protein GQ44DRAFT_825104 [Phaeosphaeriaceae sp. PMI808]
MSFRNLFSSITRSTLLLAFLSPHLVRPQATQTISSDPAYQSLRACGQLCFYLQKQDVLGNNLKCCKQQYCLDQADEQCYCREDLGPKATSYLSQCVNNRCSSPVDFTSAVNVYDSYCDRNRNVMVTPTTTPPAGTATSPARTATPPAVTTTPPAVTATPPAGTVTEKSQTVSTGTGAVTVVVTVTSGAAWGTLIQTVLW